MINWINKIWRGSKMSGNGQAIVIVDYTYWLGAYRGQYKILPHPREWLQTLQANYAIKEVRFYGDSFCDDAGPLLLNNSFPTAIIESPRDADGVTRHFLMLDYIYRLPTHSYDTLILFAGRNQLRFCLQYVRSLGKRAVLYDVCRSGSALLREASDEWHELPFPGEELNAFQRMFVEDLDMAYKNPQIIPTYWTTIKFVARRNHIQEYTAQAVLNYMLEQKLIIHKEAQIDRNKKISILKPVWEKLIAAGLWDPNIDL